jgi:hypothetical protein
LGRFFLKMKATHMNAMFRCRGIMDDCDRLSLRPFPTGVSAVELADSAASRRYRIQDIETEIDRLCEREALRHRRRVLGSREAWDRQTWRRYVAEAIRQTQLYASERARLRREAGVLERLIQMLNGCPAAARAAQPKSEA